MHCLCFFFSGRKLHVINLSHQTEAGDLFGGYKPVELASQMHPLIAVFGPLFKASHYFTDNEKFLAGFEVIHVCGSGTL